MKFSSSLSTLLFASAVVAAPPVSKRQTTPVQVVASAINDVSTAVAADQAAISACPSPVPLPADRPLANWQSPFSYAGSAVASLKDNAQATLTAAQKTINDALAGVLTVLKSSASNIVGATSGAAGGLQKTASGYAQQEIDVLASTVNAAATAILGLSASVQLAVTNLTPAAQQAVQSEIDAVKAAIKPLLDPLLLFVSAVQKLSASTNVQLNGLQSASDNLVSAANKVSASLGGPQYSPPQYTGPTGGGATTPSQH
jgi:hypothetical protein